MILLALASIVTLTPTVAERIALDEQAITRCSGDADMAACAREARISSQLRRDGWCFDQDAAWRIADRQWRRCHR